MLRLDHIVVVAEDLTGGTEHVSSLLGVDLQRGGEHAFMGTHNTLLSLGPDAYLEVIAVNPDAPAPEQPRWFGMDMFSGPPRLTNWVCSSDDFNADHTRAPVGMEHVIDAVRGELRWKMAVPTAGQYPFAGAFPGMIAWHGSLHPCAMLHDRGVRLEALDIKHPCANALSDALARLDPAAPVTVGFAEKLSLRARLTTPRGEVVL